MKFLHTADWQIGMKAADLGAAGEKVRAERLQAALRVVEVARQHAVDFLLVAGDTFEDNAVDRVTVRKVADILASAGRPVFIIPGNHDPLVPGSVWDQSVWQTIGAVQVLREDRAVEIPGGILFPCVCTEKHARRDPTAWIAAATRATAPGAAAIRIGLAHGTVEGVDPKDAEYPIPRDAAARAGLDYLALGHWHSFGSFADAGGSPRMAYSGTHEPTKFGERDSGNVLIVEIDRPCAPPRVTPSTTRRFTWAQHAPDLRGVEDLARFVIEIEQVPDPDDHLIDIRLRGVLRAVEMPELARLRELLSARFFFHRLDESALRLAPDDDSWVDRLPPGVLRNAAAHLQALTAIPETGTVEPAGVPTGTEVATRALLELFALTTEVER